MHIVHHFDPLIPAIISETAHGDLRGLQKKCTNDDLEWLTIDMKTLVPPALWIRIAAQLTSALDYILCHSPLVHADLKPGNIFYQLAPNTNPANEPIGLRCMIADYGICPPKDMPITQISRFCGTVEYNPPAYDWALWTDAARPVYSTTHLSVYQWATTILDLLSAPVKSRLHFPYQFIRRPSTIADIIRDPSKLGRSHYLFQDILDNMPLERTDAQKALHSLVYLISLDDYSPDDILRTRRLFAEHIHSAADSINAGIEYYTIEPRKRETEERACLVKATELYTLACERESQLPEEWHADRPESPRPPYN